jgi:glucuronate isomerase
MVASQWLLPFLSAVETVRKVTLLSNFTSKDSSKVPETLANLSFKSAVELEHSAFGGQWSFMASIDGLPKAKQLPRPTSSFYVF